MNTCSSFLVELVISGAWPECLAVTAVACQLPERVASTRQSIG